jgi:hypothetical protein
MQDHGCNYIHTVYFTQNYTLFKPSHLSIFVNLEKHNCLVINLVCWGPQNDNIVHYMGVWKCDYTVNGIERMYEFIA